MKRLAKRRGFTLVEVLAAIAIIAIVLPSVMYGIGASSRLAGVARRRAQATTLAESKLNEILVTNAWQGSLLSGDFGDLAPGFTWEAAVTDWPDDADTSQIDLYVRWTSSNQAFEVVVSTLAYRNAGGTTAGGLF